MKKLWMISCILISLFCNCVFALETIVFFRHGEKPSGGMGEITCQGLNRALALPRVLYGKFGMPNYIFAADPAGPSGESGTNYVRPLATIEPTAIQFIMPVLTPYKFDQDSAVANELVAEKYHNSKIFIIWEHEHVVTISRAIVQLAGGNPSIIPEWPDAYDPLYVIKIDWSTTPTKVTFTLDAENLNGQSTTCPTANPAEEHATVKTKDITTQRMIFIPEAEAAVGGLGQLSCKGLNRALALAKMLTSTFGTIDKYIAAAPGSPMIVENGQSYYFHRAIMTIEPIVASSNLGMFIPKGYQDVQGMANYLNNSNFYNKTLAIAWQLGEIAPLVRTVYQTFGGNINDIPCLWPDNDTIYLITVVRNGTQITTTFNQYAENLNNVSTICPQPLP